MKYQLPLIDRLESRVFFSASPAQVVAADQAKLAADKAQLSTDRQTYANLLSGDRSQLKSDLSTESSSAVTQLKIDQAAEKQAVLTDQQNGAATLAGDRLDITADKNAVAADKNDPTAEAAALAKLASDRQILSTDNSDLKSTLTATRTNGQAAIKTDTANLNIIRKQTGTTLSADKSKITTDLSSAASTYYGDEKTIVEDQSQLEEDELAELGSNILGAF